MPLPLIPPAARRLAGPCRFVATLLAWPASTAWAQAAAPAVAGAAPAAAEGTQSAWGELLGIVLPLVLIIVVLLAVLYLLRRRFGLTGQDAPLTVVQILPLGPRERLVLVRSRSGRLFTVGVGAQSVTLVTQLDPEDLVAPLGMEDATTLDTVAPGETSVRPRLRFRP